MKALSVFALSLAATGLAWSIDSSLATPAGAGTIPFVVPIAGASGSLSLLAALARRPVVAAP